MAALFAGGVASVFCIVIITILVMCAKGNGVKHVLLGVMAALILIALIYLALYAGTKL